MKVVIATIKSWNIENAIRLKDKYKGVHDVVVCSSKDEFSVEEMKKIQPDYIFLPHWSYYIPDDIVKKYNCVVFHMTDLPYGRGGSPLQNLIVRGHKTTKISALRATEALDAGPIYMKCELSLEGSAQEIFERCSNIIFDDMIPEIIESNIEPVEQSGEPVIFRRRKPEDGLLTADMDLFQIYDYIRMLDAEGYPRAYIDIGEYRLSFDSAKMLDDGQQLEAKVIFQRKI